MKYNISERTHYEMMLEDFPYVKTIFEQLDRELPPEYMWDDFMHTSVMQSYYMEGAKYDQANAMTACQMIFHLYSYNRGMGRTYHVCEGISEMLLNTKLDVDTSIVKAPFKEIQITIPPTGILEIWNESTEFHPAWCLYVNFSEQEQGTKMLRVLMVGKPNQNSSFQYDDALVYFRVPLLETTVGKSIDECLYNWSQDPMNKVFKIGRNEGVIKRAYQFVLNILLYLTSSEPDIVKWLNPEAASLRSRLDRLKSASKKRKVEKKLKGMTKIPIYMVGKSINISKEDIDSYRSIRGNRKHSIRYPVGGHWRMQWYGSKEKRYQKQKWIRPHFRGPELADIVRSTGVLK